MCDWIDRTLELFRSRDDLLLLKPHPGELRPNNPEEEPDEKLSDFVEGEIDTENIVLLGPRDVGSAALYQQIDCGLVWRSSIGIEMTVLGLPCVVSGKAHWRSYFSLSEPKNYDEYISTIDEVPHHEIGKENQTKAAVFLHFFKHYLHYFVPYIKNVDYGGLDPTIIRWNKQRLQTFFQEGDNNIDAILHQLNINKLEDLWSVEDELRRQFPELMGEGTTSNA
jgi:capsular polysaccharide export protein